MNEGLIPRRYAKALYEYALERNADKRVYQLMKTLEESFVAEVSLQSALSNPYIPVGDKLQLLTTAAAADKTDTVYADYLKLLARNHRFDVARGIAIAYMSIYREANHIYDVKVVSAAPMTSGDDARMRALIGKHLNGGTLEYSCSVDSSLIGGFTVVVGNERIDASVKNELKQLRLNLLSK